MKSTVNALERLTAAANAVIAQAMENPDLGIPADPDVADFMGCFEERAVSPDDFINLDEDQVEPQHE